MAIHKRSFKCFDALLDDLSQKVPLPFGVRTVTTPRGTHSIKHLEQLQDGGCYLCSDRRLAKPVNMELASKRPGVWYHHSRKPQRPEASSATPPGHLSYRQRRILLVKNSDPGVRRSVVLSRRSTRSLGTFLDAVSEVMQFHVRKLYTAEGRRIDSVQSLMTCPGVLVCVGREALSPMLVNFMRKSSEEKLPAHSRASEYSEVHESKKNVNFGLETKKSIIHPRSDSSSRSARFSLSSEKSYSNGVRPSIVNDDIEKRVVVNKDGSLSVEMRVRFRLHNDETLQWSTQVKKSPPLTNECQAPPRYLQQGQSESCSDPDSSSFDPEGVDYSNQNGVMEANGCPCCYQRQEQQYDLWENPAHCHKHHPVPPPPASRHTVTRQTRSSSSSSSCNSRRVVRCRARGSEPSKIVQEEMFVTEQVELEQDGDTRVEVCTVSRGCSRSEVVAIDRKSVAEDDERPLSVISSSSRVLQSLKEDQDDELPPSASQCCRSIEPTHKEDEEEGKSRAASSSHCGADTPHPTADDRAPSSKSQRSRASDRSGDNKIPNTEGEEDADIKRVVSSLSQKSSSVCSNCGGCKREANSESTSRASQRSDRSHKAPSKPPTPLVDNGSDDEGSECSVGSTQSNRSNITGRCSAVSHMLEERASSHMSSPEEGGVEEEGASDSDVGEDAEEERAGSSLSDKSGASVKTITKAASPTGSAGVEEEDTHKRSPSVLSVKPDRPESVLSAKSSKSNVSAKSGRSHKSSCSHCARPVSAAAQGTIEPEEGVEVEERAASAASAKSNLSAKSNTPSKALGRSESAEGEEERPASRRSGRSYVSVKSSKSCKSNGIDVAEPPCSEEKEDELVEDEVASPAVSERATSAMSGKTNKSSKSQKSSAVSPNPSEADIPPIETTGAEEQHADQERVASALSVKSKSSAKSRTSHKACNSLKPVSSTPLVDGEGKETTERAPSAASAKSRVSTSSRKSNRNKLPEADAAETRGSSALSVHSAKSGRRSCGKASALDKERKEEDEEEEEKDEASEEASERAASVLSTKSQRKDSGDTERPLSRNSSVSLGLAEDPETADSDSGKSSVCSHVNTEKKGRAKTATPQETRPTASQNSRKSPHNCPEIPTINTPGGSQVKQEGGEEETTERQASAMSAKSSRSHKSSSRVKAATKEQNELDVDDRTSSAMSSSSVRGRSRSSASARAKKANDNGAEKETDSRAESVDSKSGCCLRPKSAVSAHSGSRTKASKQSAGEGSVKSSTAKSSVKSSAPQKKGTSSHSHSSTLSQSLSAADLLKDTTARPQSQSSVRSQRREEAMTPACLPNASPNEVVSDWLRSIPNSMMGAKEEEEEEEEKPAEEEGVHEEGEEKEREEEVEVLAQGKEADVSPQDAKSWKSSAAVMKVLLSCSMGRCKSMPEVSPVYGRKLSTSARGLLDCLTQLQLIDPAGGQQKTGDQRYEDVMVILQSLWLTEQKDDLVKEQVSPPRSSSGLGMSSGSAGSGKDNGNHGGDETKEEETKEASLHAEKAVEKAVEQEEGGEVHAEAEPEETDVHAEAEPEETDVHAEAEPEETDVHAEAEPEETDVHAEAEPEETDVHAEVVLPNMDSLKNTKDPSSSSGNDSSDNKRDTLDDSSSATPPTVVRASLSKRQSQDPDPVWVMQLLKKLEKQFMNHYITAMSEFKVRWDLDDSLILDTMIGELRDEVSKRIQLSIQRELKKIQGRAGRSPRPPQRGTLSRESTMTDRRRRILKVMKNQPKTAESQSDGEMAGEFSDQRSEDDYCPCDECVRKKMAARPLRKNPIPSAELPMSREFDLLKILQLKKSPSPVLAVVPVVEEEEGDSEVAAEEGRNLEVVQEEEEEQDAKEDIQGDEEGGAGSEEKDEGEEAGEVEQEEETGSGKEEEAVKEEATGEEEEAPGETEEDDGARNEEDEGVEDAEEGGKETEEERASSQCQEVKNDGDAVEEVKPEEEVKKRDVLLLHQFTKTSVESQSGSLEDIDTDCPPIPIDSIEVPKMVGGGTGQRRSRSPGRVKCRKPKDNELDDQ
ncbi:retinitis pigmentosa 1-like 1 protein [Pseudochaenichthys georgianus]|uniref:retinitis pigmentosa 1-like 1 protein n=1 Tax=Pseudochaenichthys georgianus TaxID=52239 RepID=UPI0039C3CA54